MNAVEASPSPYTAGGLVVIPGGTEHEAWFREGTEVIDFFAPARDDLQSRLHERRLNSFRSAVIAALRRWHERGRDLQGATGP